MILTHIRFKVQFFVQFSGFQCNFIAQFSLFVVQVVFEGGVEMCFLSLEPDRSK